MQDENNANVFGKRMYNKVFDYQSCFHLTKQKKESTVRIQKSDLSMRFDDKTVLPIEKQNKRTGEKKKNEKSAMETLLFLEQLEVLIHERKTLSPELSYVAKMYQKGFDKMLQKVGEEATEYIIDCKNQDKERVVSEAADLLFHFILSLTAQQLSLQDVVNELIQRHTIRNENVKEPIPEKTKN